MLEPKSLAIGLHVSTDTCMIIQCCNVGSGFAQLRIKLSWSGRKMDSQGTADLTKEVMPSGLKIQNPI